MDNQENQKIKAERIRNDLQLVVNRAKELELQKVAKFSHIPSQLPHALQTMNGACL